MRRGSMRRRVIFSRPEIAAEFRRLIAETMKGSDAVTIRQSLARSEPVHCRNLKVNQQYPKGVPLQTTPPSLLLNLPKLPKGYEYRVVNNSLRAAGRGSKFDRGYHAERDSVAMQRRTFLQLLAGASLCRLAPGARVSFLLREKSVRFAVIGDNGTGERPEYEVAEQMAIFREKVQFDFVIMLGDNIYGGESPADFKRKFEDPYKKLLDAGVKFYASLGNHDNPNQRFYKPFNMDGRRYYDYRRGNAAFFALDSNYMDPEQIAWLRKELAGLRCAVENLLLSPSAVLRFEGPRLGHRPAQGPGADLQTVRRAGSLQRPRAHL